MSNITELLLFPENDKRQIMTYLVKHLPIHLKCKLNVDTRDWKTVPDALKIISYFPLPEKVGEEAMRHIVRTTNETSLKDFNGRVILPQSILNMNITFSKKRTNGYVTSTCDIIYYFRAGVSYESWERKEEVFKEIRIRRFSEALRTLQLRFLAWHWSPYNDGLQKAKNENTRRIERMRQLLNTPPSTEDECLACQA